MTARDAWTPLFDWTPPSVRLMTVRRIELGAVVVPVIAGGAVIGALSSGVTAAIVVGLLLLAFGAVVELFLRRRIRAWGYAERAEDLVVRRGVLVRRLSVVPYGRMQYVDVTAGPIERAFGLATVRLHTAAAATDARIPGLSVIEAARLRDSLAALGEAKAAGL